MKEVMSYSYDPLPESHIRLLAINHDSKPGSIRCQFQDHHIDQCPSYIALSYTWGPLSSNDSIILHGQKLTIRRNLASFFESLIRVHRKLHLRNPELKFLRSKTLPLLWIDQICINQEDVLERNHQITMMSLVYAFASGVLAWLGPRISLPRTRSITCAKELLHPKLTPMKRSKPMNLISHHR
jgi:hypothetical protein